MPHSHPATIPSAHAGRPDRAFLVAVAGMLALASSLGIGRFVYTPILPSMAGALGFGAGAAGLIASANFAGYLAGGVAAMAPRLPGGKRAWFAGGLLIGAGTTAGMGLVSAFPLFLGFRFLGGASSAFVLVLGTASVLDALAASGRSGLRWIHYAGVGLGITISAAAVSWFETAGADWRALWLLAGALAFIMLLPPLVTLRWRRTGGNARAMPARLGAGIWPLAVCHALFGFGYVVTATFLVAMTRAARTGSAIEPMVWLVVGVAALPSLLPWDFAAARVGARRGYAFACVLEAVSVLLAGGWPTPAGLLLASALFGGTFMGLTALGFAAARELGLEGQERRFAVITVGFGLGQAVGPLVGGTVSDWTGGFWAPSVLAAGALLLAAMIAMASARKRGA